MNIKCFEAYGMVACCGISPLIVANIANRVADNNNAHVDKILQRVRQCVSMWEFTVIIKNYQNTQGMILHMCLRQVPLSVHQQQRNISLTDLLILTREATSNTATENFCRSWKISSTDIVPKSCAEDEQTAGFQYPLNLNI